MFRPPVFLVSVSTGFLLGFFGELRSSIAQVSPLNSCAVSECRFSQTNGNTSSVGVGTTSSFGVSSSSQSTPNYNTSSSASLVLDGQLFGSPVANSSRQSIGSEASTAPINISITSTSIQTKDRDGFTAQSFSQEEQTASANLFSDDSSSESKANFSAEGFGAIQDLRFKGASPDQDGSLFKSSVVPVLINDADGNPVLGTAYGTGNSSANAESRTRFQADITTSTFVNAFLSSF
jgi:hypothetical protein